MTKHSILYINIDNIMKALKNIFYFFPSRFPPHVDIELNNTCNQKCIMCWHYSIPPFKLGKMPLVTALKIINQSKGAKSVKFNWRGEPTLYKDLKTCLKYAKSLGLRTVINTNGIVGIELLESLIDYLDIIIVSVDSFDPQVYAQIHNCGLSEHELLLENISKMLAWILLGRKLELQFNIHISQYNTHEMVMNRWYQEIYQGVKFNYAFSENREGKNISIRKNIEYKKRCNQMYRRLVVSWNGDIYPCCIAYKEPKELRLGNIKDMTLRQAWNGYKLKKLRKLKKQNKLVYCQTCTSREVMK